MNLPPAPKKINALEAEIEKAAPKGSRPAEKRSRGRDTAPRTGSQAAARQKKESDAEAQPVKKTSRQARTTETKAGRALKPQSQPIPKSDRERTRPEAESTRKPSRSSTANPLPAEKPAPVAARGPAGCRSPRNRLRPSPNRGGRQNPRPPTRRTPDNRSKTRAAPRPSKRRSHIGLPAIPVAVPQLRPAARPAPASPRPNPTAEKGKDRRALNLPAKIQITDFCTVKELAEKLSIKLKPLEEKMAQLKMNYQSNQIIDRADIEKLCADYGVAVEIIPYEDYMFQSHVAKSGSLLTTRPPVVTVMGHVDHGKTTLLDTLRKTRVAEKEAGGITQKIGAYKLKTAEGAIIFIDTPGHEAFTNLRARGAKVTDIVILVVAANDGVQPQTVEAINHAQAAKVPMIVAINKIDIAGADLEKVKQDLNRHNILVEEWGGKVVSVEISAKMNKNLDQLLEMIQLVAQMQELKAYVQIPARGTIIESRLDPQLGPIGTVLIQHGQLKKGDYFICGNTLGKIKSIFDDSGKMLDSRPGSRPDRDHGL